VDTGSVIAERTQVIRPFSRALLLSPMPTPTLLLIRVYAGPT